MWMVLECFRCWFIHSSLSKSKRWTCPSPPQLRLWSAFAISEFKLIKGGKDLRGKRSSLGSKEGKHSMVLWFQNYFMGMIEIDVLFRERGKYWKGLEEKEGRKQTSSKIWLPFLPKRFRKIKLSSLFEQCKKKKKKKKGEERKKEGRKMWRKGVKNLGCFHSPPNYSKVNPASMIWWNRKKLNCAIVDLVIHDPFSRFIRFSPFYLNEFQSH